MVAEAAGSRHSFKDSIQIVPFEPTSSIIVTALNKVNCSYNQVVRVARLIEERENSSCCEPIWHSLSISPKVLCKDQ